MGARPFSSLLEHAALMYSMYAVLGLYYFTIFVGTQVDRGGREFKGLACVGQATIGMFTATSSFLWTACIAWHIKQIVLHITAVPSYERRFVAIAMGYPAAACVLALVCHYWVYEHGVISADTHGWDRFGCYVREDVIWLRMVTVYAPMWLCWGLCGVVGEWSWVGCGVIGRAAAAGCRKLQRTAMTRSVSPSPFCAIAKTAFPPCIYSMYSMFSIDSTYCVYSRAEISVPIAPNSSSADTKDPENTVGKHLRANG